MKKHVGWTGVTLSFLFLNLTTLPLADGWVSIFDGKTLNGWKASENPGTFTVQDGAIVVFGPRAHLYIDRSPGISVKYPLPLAHNTGLAKGLLPSAGARPANGFIFQRVHP